MAASLGIQEPDELDVTLVNILEKIINDEDVEPGEGFSTMRKGLISFRLISSLPAWKHRL